MDLAFTPEEQAFREEIRAWVKDNLPADIAHKVHNALRLSRDDMQRWARILGKKGWLGWGWPQQFGGPGWSAVQKHLFEEECALAGAPRVVPFGPVMVAPVIMAFGNKEQQERFLPGIASGEVWWSQGTGKAGWTWPRSIAPNAGHTIWSTARRPGPRSASTANGSSAWCAPAPKASPRPASASC
jgi:alkylation response protein AidB-like acyl-CoA dehydrogenase